MPQTLQPQAISILVIFPFLGTLACCARLYTRVAAKGRSTSTYLIWSDIILAIALVLTIGASIVIIVVTKKGYLGYHIKDVPASALTLESTIDIQRWSFANQLLYNPVLGAIRASVILFLLHLFGHVNTLRYYLYTIFFLNSILFLVVFCMDAFQCRPISYVWNWPAMDVTAQQAAGANANGMLNGELIKGGHCYIGLEFYITSAAFSALADILVLALPAIRVSTLKVSRKQRLAVIAVLCVGIGVTGVSIARIFIFIRNYNATGDALYYTTSYTISSVEMGLGLVAACANDFRFMITKVAPKLFSSNQLQESNARNGEQSRVVGRGRSGSYPLRSFDNAVGGCSDSEECIIRVDTDFVVTKTGLVVPSNSEQHKWDKKL